jgi:hypothetical protein
MDITSKLQELNYWREQLSEWEVWFWMEKKRHKKLEPKLEMK